MQFDVMATVTTTELIDTGEKRDALGRRHTPAERRVELLAIFQGKSPRRK